MNKKIILFINIIISVLISVISLLYYREEIIKKQNSPIVCSVVQMDCAGSSRNHPKVYIQYNQKRKSVDVTNCNTLKVGLNKKDFFYDKLLDRVFYINSGIKKGWFVSLGVFVFSLLFWMIPKNRL
ncbi:hypothetical protein BN1195_00246 [Chryseobacterium oranimense G311]|uniref:hypothetical protein n=1 Tax=Chryseobacterium oranimense TaxID=421058 RepID=UPI000533980E|nr:hypothetical protein [Chryseobacterium oranimense]CEJ67964.1 hypothetical protein BN1195_00246 [Chryseobacterium oranimense G311]